LLLTGYKTQVRPDLITRFRTLSLPSTVDERLSYERIQNLKFLPSDCRTFDLLRDKKIAPKQFEIIKTSDGWYISPLNVKAPFYPTKLNGKLLESKTKLSKGDKIQIADVEFEIL